MEPDRYNQDNSHANDSNGDADSPPSPYVDVEGVGPEEEGAVGWLDLPSPFSPDYVEAVFNLFHPAGPSDAPMVLHPESDHNYAYPPGLRPGPLGPIPMSLRDIEEAPSMSHASPADIYFDDTGIRWNEAQEQMSDSDEDENEDTQRIIEELCADFPPPPPPDAPNGAPMEEQTDAEVLANAAHADFFQDFVDFFDDDDLEQ